MRFHALSCAASMGELELDVLCEVLDAFGSSQLAGEVRARALSARHTKELLAAHAAEGDVVCQGVCAAIDDLSQLRQQQQQQR